MDRSVKGKTAIVTGSGSDLALRPEAQELVDKYSSSTPRAVFQKTDVTDWAQLERMFEVAEAEFGGVDVVCPGAGVFEPAFSGFWNPPGSAESRDRVSGSRYAQVDINIVHPIRTTQLAVARFANATTPKSIVHTSSIAGQVATFSGPIYAASKHAINGFVRSLSKLDKIGIRVTAVAPGLIKTPLWTDNPDKLRMVDEENSEWVTPEQVATVMLALVQQNEISESSLGIPTDGDAVIKIKGGTILEVSKSVRRVAMFNDEGPLGRPGNTVGDLSEVDDGLLASVQSGSWGKPSPKIPLPPISPLDAYIKNPHTALETALPSDIYAAMDDDTGAGGAAAAAGSGRSRRRQWPGKKDVGVVGQAGWTSSVINLVNTIVGAGALAMPHAISRMGMFLGVTVVLWAGLTSAFGLYLQTRCARYLERGSSSFFALSQITYPNAAVIFDAAISIKCFGVGVSYLIIIGDLMPGVIEGIVALISIGYLVILVVAHFIKGDTMADRGPIRIIEWQGLISALSVFPVIVFAYTCHQNMFSILNEIANDSHYRTTSVIVASIGSAAATYVLVGVTGYLSFGDTIGGNIVGMYAPSLTSTIARAAIVILVVFSYPLQIHPCRASLDAVLKWRPNRKPTLAGSNSPNRNPLLPRNNAPSDGMSDMRFAIITTVIIVLSYIVAMTVSSLEAVLAYVGATGSTSISFILPGLFYYKISSPESAAHQRLMKEDDELAADEIADEVDSVSSNAAAGQSLLGRSYSTFMSRSTKQWRRGLLRKLSLALAVYGVVVMVVCLVTNTFFLASDVKG
ncbi:uncharacterized protein GIQ15_06668 [Arthroderma uncinatum]|uniref:uncharacterized protein n=1 Tax=Arthroderma uncinatum TaxID=74035 RepID=UPI00144AEB00|nr:uncharacterized protein GIQ15_06668 [Arthroderma uncinatum]KAF3479692.1 hypothetical protein GIQ15_06668 [Arthroderma uncinatum]